MLALVADESQHIVTQVSYDRLVAGQMAPGEGRAVVHSGVVDLVGATDPGDEQYAFLDVTPGARLIEFELTMMNTRGARAGNPIRTSRFRLRDTVGEEQEALLAVIDGSEIAPAEIESGEFATVRVLFELAGGRNPAELQYDVLEYFVSFGEQIDWEFR